MKGKPSLFCWASWNPLWPRHSFKIDQGIRSDFLFFFGQAFTWWKLTPPKKHPQKKGSNSTLQGMITCPTWAKGNIIDFKSAFFRKFVSFEEGISFSQEIVENMIFQKKNIHPQNLTCPQKRDYFNRIYNTSSNRWFSWDMLVFRGVHVTEMDALLILWGSRKCVRNLEDKLSNYHLLAHLLVSLKFPSKFLHPKGIPCWAPCWAIGQLLGPLDRFSKVGKKR